MAIRQEDGKYTLVASTDSTTKSMRLWLNSLLQIELAEKATTCKLVLGVGQLQTPADLTMKTQKGNEVG